MADIPPISNPLLQGLTPQDLERAELVQGGLRMTKVLGPLFKEKTESTNPSRVRSALSTKTRAAVAHALLDFYKKEEWIPFLELLSKLPTDEQEQTIETVKVFSARDSKKSKAFQAALHVWKKSSRSV
jgi:hypothetical protein